MTPVARLRRGELEARPDVIRFEERIVGEDRSLGGAGCEEVVPSRPEPLPNENRLRCRVAAHARNEAFTGAFWLAFGIHRWYP